MKILYLFPTPRVDLIKKVSAGKASDSLLYGFNHLKKLEFDVSYLDLPMTKSSIYFWLFAPIESILVKLTGISFQIYRILPKLKTINQFDLVVTCSEPLGLPLAFLKKLRLLRGKQLYLSLDFASRFRNNRDRLLKIFFKWSLTSPEAIVCFSKIEKNYFREIFNVPKERLHFIPAGSDPKFFRPKRGPGEFILSVGKDRSRDFATFFNAFDDFNKKVILITGPRTKIPTSAANVKILRDVSYVKLHSFYQRAKLLVLPLFEQQRAAGQLALLDTMLCGIPVIVSRVLGITTAYEFQDKRHCFFVEPGNVSDLRKIIKYVLSHPILAKEVAVKARRKVIANYSTAHFANNLSQIIRKL